MSMTKLTITLEPAIVAKLPRKNKSYAINQILKQHFQKEGVDSLYETIKQQLLEDDDVVKMMRDTVGDVIHEERGY